MIVIPSAVHADVASITGGSGSFEEFDGGSGASAATTASTRARGGHRQSRRIVVDRVRQPHPRAANDDARAAIAGDDVVEHARAGAAHRESGAAVVGERVADDEEIRPVPASRSLRCG